MPSGWRDLIKSRIETEGIEKRFSSMDELPIEFIGQRNFPDITVEQVDFQDKQVRIVGEMLIESSIDHTLVDGFSELQFISNSENQTVTFFEKKDVSWQSCQAPNLATIYLIYCEGDGVIVLEGYDSNAIPARVVIPNGSVWHKYL